MDGVPDQDVVLWQATDGMRCTFRRRTFGPPFEVTIQCGSEVMRRVAFDRDEEAADFAIDAMRRADAAAIEKVPLRSSHA